jgi:hypothetical protein
VLATKIFETMHHDSYGSYHTDYGLSYDNTPNSPIKTLFLQGFSEDASDREIHNLLRFTCVGYEFCATQRKPNGHCTVFARFSDRPCAFSAIQRLNGILV